MATALVAAALLVGCGGESSPTRAPRPSLAQLDLPGAEEIAREREAKDASYEQGPDSPIPADERAAFDGLEYYPFDPDERYVAYLRAADEPEPVKLVTTEGDVRPAVRAGELVFERDGQTHTLTTFKLRDSGAATWDQLFLPFMDETTGEETYAAGRYLRPELAGPSGDWYVLDFNRAYHPLCAYGGAGYSCPRTPEENRLPFAIRAGERGRSHQPLPAEASASPSGEESGNPTPGEI